MATSPTWCSARSPPRCWPSARSRFSSFAEADAVVAIRSILLHVDATPASVARLKFAHALADRHGAKVTALFGVRPHVSQVAYVYSAGAALRAFDEGSAPHEHE